ncbi:MAG: XRE family transcriptional regulator [Gammaproteobacteria bacterium]
MNHLSAKISSTLKMLRNQRGWSLDVTSGKTGVSKAMLGQIERGESSPTISTLWKIASGFDVSFSSFVEDVEPYQPGFTHRKPELQQLHKEDKKIKVMPIFPFDEHLRFEVFIIELLPDCTHLSPPHQKGVIEHVIPVSGFIEVLIDEQWRKVNQHEGLRFDASVPHGYRNPSSQSVLFHDMIHYTHNR